MMQRELPEYFRSLDLALDEHERKGTLKGDATYLRIYDQLARDLALSGVGKDQIPIGAESCGHLSTFNRLGHLMSKPLKSETGDAFISTDAIIPTKMSTWTRGEKITAWSVVVAVLTLIAAALVVPEFRRIIGLEKPIGTGQTRSQPEPTTRASEPKAHAPDKPVVAESAKDVRELRQQNRVTRIEQVESGKTLEEIPVNSYGFANGLDFIFRRAFIELRQLRASRLIRDFEVHKLADGSALIVGYVGKETLTRLREGLRQGESVTLYSDSWKEASNLVAIPLTRLLCTRSRVIDIEKGTVGALDCQAD
jgi:hypothetical protein